MNVSEMLSTMQNLGIGDVYRDSDTNRILLNFLNLAHDELYRETASFNINNFFIDTITSIANTTSIQLTKIPFLISNVFPVGFYVPGNELEGMDFIDFTKYTIRFTNPGVPLVYSNVGQELNFYPISPGIQYTFKIFYPPERTRLEINTPESAIPYPLSYHGVLVDGGLYYLFQDESGFKNTLKENEALRRWKSGKANLIAYLKGYSKQKTRTYSSV